MQKQSTYSQDGCNGSEHVLYADTTFLLCIHVPLGISSSTGAMCLCQVTFHLSKDNIFTAEAVDLNSGRHHLWQVSLLLHFKVLGLAPYPACHQSGQLYCQDCIHHCCASCEVWEFAKKPQGSMQESNGALIASGFQSGPISESMAVPPVVQVAAA